MRNGVREELSRPWWVLAAIDVAVSVSLAAAVAMLNVPVLSTQGFVTIWFGGLAIGVLYLVPIRRWPIYLIVLLLVNVYGVLQSPHSMWDAGPRAAVDLLIVPVTAWYLVRTVAFPLGGVGEAWRLIAVALGVGGVRGVVDGLIDSFVPDGVNVTSVSPLSYGLNAFVGLLLFIPLATLAGSRRSWPRWRSPDHFGLSLIPIGALALLVGTAFFQPVGTAAVGWAFVAVPLIGLLAALFSQLSLSVGLVVVGLGMAYGTAWGLGPFAPVVSNFRSLSVAALNVELFLAAIPATAWLLAAAMREQRSARDDARRSAARLEETIDSAPNPMAVWRGSGLLETVNDAFAAFVNRSEAELKQGTWLTATGGAPIQVTTGAERHEFRLPDGSIKWGLLSVARMASPDDAEPVYVAQIVDVTGEEQAQKAALAAQAQTRRLLDYDAVTGLHSRSWITDALGRSLEDNAADPTRVSVMFIDLSAFEDVASDLSFETSDVLFRDLAEAITDVLADPWILGRFETTHVVAVTAALASPEELARSADAVLARLEQDVVLQAMRISRSASVGMARGAAGSTAQSLLRDANHALLVAKARGRSQAFLAAPDIGLAPRHQLGLEHEIREALDLRQFVLHFQPQVDLMTGAVVAHEALVRWRHPTRGLLSPDAFIGTAEKTGLIVPLGAHVVELACLAIRNNPGLPGPVSVNVSAVELAQSGWSERFLRTMEQYEVEMHRLAVEVTETSVLELTDEASVALRVLRDCGMTISVDDFGTGYAAVRMLQMLPVTELKLDRTFVTQLSDPDNPGLNLVRGIANLAEGMGLHVVAEGIETVEEALILRAAGYGVGQGYLFAKPSPELVRTVPFSLPHELERGRVREWVDG